MRTICEWHALEDSLGFLYVVCSNSSVARQASVFSYLGLLCSVSSARSLAGSSRFLLSSLQSIRALGTSVWPKWIAAIMFAKFFSGFHDGRQTSVTSIHQSRMSPGLFSRLVLGPHPLPNPQEQPGSGNQGWTTGQDQCQEHRFFFNVLLIGLPPPSSDLFNQWTRDSTSVGRPLYLSCAVSFGPSCHTCGAANTLISRNLVLSSFVLPTVLRIGSVNVESTEKLTLYSFA